MDITRINAQSGWFKQKYIYIKDWTRNRVSTSIIYIHKYSRHA